ncbi:DEAD/DEAH box helicase [Rothia aerolata]|uniref:DNA helicase n=1 Tax=Rothia aerolata TaxID=1812262 RepID=A0A917IR16_9MICC|nr:DNA helicase [Rothia aerolata]GGH60186.1 hypothetical protein GCM10007359_08120 [Rothia aerolata]
MDIHPDRTDSLTSSASGQQDTSENLQAGLDAWSQQMDFYTGPDALLDFNQVDYVHIDITESNPSGLAQLMMGRKTRLSTILNDRAKFDAGMVAAHALRSKIFELETHHGLSAGYFAAGTASWLSRDIHGRAGASEKRFIAPILLAPVTITPHPNSKDFEIRLAGDAKLNPAMVRQLKKEFGVDLSTLDVAQLANSMSKLDPEPVIDRMRTSVGHLPGMMIQAKYLISTFADLKENTAALPEESFTPLVRNLARLADPSSEPVFPEAYIKNSALPLDDRQPEHETLIFDADSSAQEIIDLATTGHSLVVTAATGTDPLRTATNIASSLISRGKSVMVVGEKSSTLKEFSQLLESKKLEDLSFSLLEDHTSEELRRLMISAIVRNEQVAEPNMRPVWEQLVEVRSKLANHTSSLMFTESRWGCSVYESLQTLAALTAQDDAPNTSVRLSRDVMDALVERGETAEQLKRLAHLAGFKSSTRFSPWRGAKLVNDEETAAAHALVLSLLENLDRMVSALQQMCQLTGMRLGRTLEDWEQQLDLLTRMHSTLTRFRPDVYDRPVTDLIAATASGSWRREHGIEMSSIQRSRLRKAAKEYILPGVHISDLHEYLLVIQGEREEWIDWAESPREPQIPENLQELRDQLAELVQEFSGLQLVLEDSPEGADFLQTDFSAIKRRLQALRDDRYLLTTLPERVELERSLVTAGLGELMSDLRARQVSEEKVGAELELAWWQTALEMMLSADEIEILDGDTLRDLESSFRRLDTAHMESAPARLHAAVGRTWRTRIDRDSESANYLKSQLRGHNFDFTAVLNRAPSMATALYPLWVASPFSLTRHLGASTLRFDAVILLDSETTPLAANLPAITRADQVVAMGDPHSGFPAPFVVSALKKSVTLDEEPIESTYSALAKILPSRSLSLLVDHAVDPAVFNYLNRNFYGGALRSFPWAEEISDDVSSFIAEYIDTTGKVSDNSNLDSPGVEVSRVAQRVLEHAYKNPNQSLAVVTASVRHARRIAEEVRNLLPQYPQIAPFFSGSAREPFRVVDLSRASGLERDVIIFSLGTGKGRQGMVNHSMGQLSEEHGREYFVLGMTRARHLTRFMACVQPDDLDPNLLENGALDIYRLLREHESYQQRKYAEQSSVLNETMPANEFLENTEVAAVDMGDWLLNDMVARLNERGIHLRAHDNEEISLIASSENQSLMAGSTPSPRLRKMGTGGSTELNFPLAATSDGSPAFTGLSVRERTRLIPDYLARTGWNYMTLWTIEVFSNPEAVADRMALFLGMEKQAESHE